jgi:hypothetical protein
MRLKTFVTVLKAASGLSSAIQALMLSRHAVAFSVQRMFTRWVDEFSTAGLFNTIPCPMPARDFRIYSTARRAACFTSCR